MEVINKSRKYWLLNYADFPINTNTILSFYLTYFLLSNTLNSHCFVKQELGGLNTGDSSLVEHTIRKVKFLSKIQF